MLAFTESVVALLESRAHPEAEATPAAAVCVSTPQATAAGVLTRSPDDLPPFAADAPFVVYSITKSFLATAALMLVGQNILALDSPIARWLPAAPHADAITLRHLLRHASGLPDYGGSALYHAAVKRGDQPWSDDEFLTHAHADTLLFPPGQGWSYSNIGYMIVRQLLETVQTTRLGDILRAAIFAPLGLTATSVVTGDAELARLTFGPSSYLGSAAQPVAVAARYHVDWVAHRVVASTVTEIARFYAALLDGQLVTPALLREMCTSTPLPTMPDRPVIRPGYGMGLQIDHGWPTGPIYGHSGGGPSVQLSACSLRRESQPLTVVVALTGEDLPLTETIAMAMLRQHDR